jgi:hypothetical protein
MLTPLVPAEAGTQSLPQIQFYQTVWIPAFAGMSGVERPPIPLAPAPPEWQKGPRLIAIAPFV